MAHDAFISYSTKDKTIADAVCSKLEENKIRVWMAPRDIPSGSNFAKSIVQAINSCKVFVLIWSSHTNVSEHILNEINQAFDQGITIIPFRIQDVQPTDEMRYYFGRTHWLDAIDPPLEEHITTLRNNILVILGREIPKAESKASSEKIPANEKKTQGQRKKTPRIVSGIAIAAIAITVGWYGWTSLRIQETEVPTETTQENLMSGEVEVTETASLITPEPSIHPTSNPLPHFPAGITIAFSLPTNSIDYFNTMSKAAAAEAKAKGVKFVDLTTETEDALAQKQAIDTIITQKPSAIIISIGGTTDPNVFKDTFANAKAAGIPVLAIEAAIDDPNISALIMTDNLAVAGAEGDYICTAMKGAKGTALVIAGTFMHQVSEARQKGVTDKLEACGEKVINKYGMWDDNLVVSISNDTINTNPDLNVIFVAYDYGAAAVAALVKQKGLTAKIMVFGYDGLPEMLKAIKAGEGTGTMKQDNVRMGTESVDTAIKLIIGETIDEKILIPGIMIDKTNVDQYLTDETTESEAGY
ncbi:MAG: substrate-binding domain-containing protein [Anaerolineaceae bacterium]|nr:substrate-binding domain-containing protein [Anaerolineaceae bacterium]